MIAELTGPRPPSSVRHLGWYFRGPGEFHARASRFLADGAKCGERLMFVADDPKTEQWPPQLLVSGVLQLASVTEVYGPDGPLDPVAQQATFAAALADALADGYSGMRVAADNTSLVTDPERLSRWANWEQVADVFLAENPVTGLCSFDRARVDDDVMVALSALHLRTLDQSAH